MKNPMTAMFFGLFCLLAFSCSKKNADGLDDSSVSTYSSVKRQSIDLNEQESVISDRSAQASNLKFKVSSISKVEITKKGFRVRLGIIGSTNRFTVESIHENGLSDFSGQKTLTGETKVVINSRCSSDDCYKYLALITVVKNGAVQFQNLVISFRETCKFYSASLLPKEGRIFLQNLNDAEDLYNINPDSGNSSCNSSL